MRKIVPILLSSLMVLALGVGTASASTRQITFTLYVGSNAIEGTASDNATVTYLWKDSGGHLKAQGTETASANGGYWWGDVAPGMFLEPGDRITASDGNSTRTFVVPQLTAVVNRVKNIIKGTVPVGTRVFLECIYPGEPVPDIVCRSKKMSVNGLGQWHYRPGWNLQGGDGAEMRWKSAQGDEIYFGAGAPYLRVTIGKAVVSGDARANSTALVSLKDASTHEELGSSSSPVGVRQGFNGTLRDGTGTKVVVAPGQLVVSNVASDAEFIVPEIDVAADVVTDTVSGRCGDTGRSAHAVWISVYRTGIERGFVTTGTEEDGTFSQDMTDAWWNPSVVKHGDDVLIACVQENRDFVQKWFKVP